LSGNAHQGALLAPSAGIAANGGGLDVQQVRQVVVAGGSPEVRGLRIRVLPLPANPYVSGVQLVSVEDRLEVEASTSEHAVNVLLAGETRVVWEGRGFKQDKRLRPGQVTFVPAATDPYRFAFDGQPRTLRITIPPAALLHVAADMQHLTMELRPTLGEADPVMWRYAMELADELENPGLASALYVESLVAAIAVTLVRRYTLSGQPLAERQPGLSRRRLRLVCEYIAQNLHSELDLATLAATACLSKSHFLRSFKQSTGLTPHQYVIRERVGRARQLLSDPRLPIADVAYLLGFSSQSHFTSVFRQTTGTTPNAFRAALR
jgi:AraC family transcriptional regulator